MSIAFNPLAKAPQGQAVTVTPTISGLPGVARIEIWGFTQPGVASPTTEQGWSKLGQVLASGQSFQWQTDEWLPGTHAIATVVYNAAGVVIASWVKENMLTLPLAQYEILSRSAVSGAALQGLLDDPKRLMAVAAAAAGAAYFLFLRGKE